MFAYQISVQSSTKEIFSQSMADINFVAFKKWLLNIAKLAWFPFLNLTHSEIKTFHMN